MNRTIVLLSSAGLLLIVAVLVGLPRVTGSSNRPRPGTPASAHTPTLVPVAGQSGGSLSLTGRLSHPFVAPGTSDVFATLEVTGQAVPQARRTPVNLALVIDRSGSMSGSKIAEARRAALQLVELLGPEDRLAIAHYGNDVRTLDGRLATAPNKQAMRDFISRIAPEGGTNIGEGLVAGQAQLALAQRDFKVNRLLLLSDGQPTVGVTEPAGLVSIATRLRQGGVSVTALGVGADFNEDLMQALADSGGGSYAFIHEPSTTAALFERDLQQAGTLVARGASLSVTVPSGVRFVEVYGRSVSQSGSRVTIALPDFSAEQREKVVVHLSVTAAKREAAFDVGAFELSYHDVLAGGAGSGRVTLASAVTSDAEVAQARRDKDAVVVANKAQASANYQRAAEAIGRGDFEGAKTVLQANAALFDDAKALAGEASVADERQATAAIGALAEEAPSAPEAVRKTSVKKMKVQSLKSAGRGASAY